MNRKVLSLVLALVMMFALPVFATNVPPSDVETGTPLDIVIGENLNIENPDQLIWYVRNTNNILMENVDFNVYEKAANGDLTLVGTATSEMYQDDVVFPISYTGNADVAFAYYGPVEAGKTYVVRADLNLENDALNEDLKGWGYTDLTKALEFKVDAEGIVIDNVKEYVFGIPACQMNIQVLTDGFVGDENAEVAIGTLKVNADGYYELTSRKDGYAGNYIADKTIDFDVDHNGFVQEFRLVKDFVNNEVRFANDDTGQWMAIPEGQMIGVVVNGEVKAVIPVYYNVDDLDDAYDKENEKPYVDPQGNYAIIEDCLFDTLPVYNFTSKNNATIRVWAMTNVSDYADLGNENLNKVPAVGAEITLYENGTENVWANLTKGDVVDTQEINEFGYADFENVPADKVLEFLDPNDGFQTTTLPYLVEATKAPLGFYFQDKAEKVYVDYVQEGHIINVFLKVGSDNNSFGRIAGADRIGTALEVAKATFPAGIEEVFGHRTVILANGWSFPDALAGGVLTEAYNAPMLLTGANTLPENVEKYIVDNGVTRVIILGGTGSISLGIENQLAEKYEVSRLAGATRFDTAVAIGEHLRAQINDGEHAGFLHGKNTEGWIFVANGVEFADALTASVPAAMHGAPLLLTNGTSFTPETEAALKSWNPRKVIIIGGEASVSSALASEIRTLTNAPVERYFGENRAITSMKTAEEFFATSSKAYIASGQVFPDALVSTLLASKDKAPILLVNKDSVPTGVAEYIERSVINEFVILGGDNTVSDAVRVQLAELLK